MWAVIKYTVDSCFTPSTFRSAVISACEIGSRDFNFVLSIMLAINIHLLLNVLMKESTENKVSFYLLCLVSSTCNNLHLDVSFKKDYVQL